MAAPTENPPVAANSAPPTRNDIDEIVGANLFGVARNGQETETRDPPLSTLAITLKGVFVFGASGGIAVVRNADGLEEAVQIGQEVAPGVVLIDVKADRMVVQRGSAREKILLEGSDAVHAVLRDLMRGEAVDSASITAANTGALEKLEFTIDRESFRREVGSPQELLSQAVIVPVKDGGFLIREIQSESMVERLGLLAGDIVVAANGHNLRTADDIRSVAQSLASAKNLTIDLKRQGKTRNLRFAIK